MPYIYFAQQCRMRLVESSNTEVSDASEVPQSHGKLIFLGSPAAVFFLENCSRSSKNVLIGTQSEHNRNTKYKQ